MPGKSESYLAVLDTVSYPYEMTSKVLIRVVLVSLAISTGKTRLGYYFRMTVMRANCWCHCPSLGLHTTRTKIARGMVREKQIKIARMVLTKISCPKE